MQDLIIIENGEIAPQTVNLIKSMERQMKTAKEQYEAFKEALLTAMELHGVTKFDGDGIKISYIAETEREAFDSKKFKEELPELYDSYVKFSKVKPSVRIKVEQ